MAFVLKVGTSNLLTVRVNLPKECLKCLGLGFFLQHGSTMKSDYKSYFYLIGSVVEC